MLNKIKRKNEEIFEDFFQKSFGENSKVLVNWGYPVMSVLVESNDEDFKLSFRVNFNLETEDFDIGSKAAKKTGDGWIPEMPAINKDTINFIIQRSKQINEQLFYTSAIVQQEEEEEGENGNEQKEVKKEKKEVKKIDIESAENKKEKVEE